MRGRLGWLQAELVRQGLLLALTAALTSLLASHVLQSVYLWVKTVRDMGQEYA